jgi:hypothetical protein
LGTVPLPECKTLDIDHQAFFAFGSDWIVITDALNETAIATIARIGNHHIEERALLGATTGETNYNHGVLLKSGKAGDFISKTRIKQGTGTALSH